MVAEAPAARSERLGLLAVGAAARAGVAAAANGSEAVAADLIGAVKLAHSDSSGGGGAAAATCRGFSTFGAGSAGGGGGHLRHGRWRCRIRKRNVGDGHSTRVLISHECSVKKSRR